MEWIPNIISSLLILGGVLLGITGALGLLRFQDFYTRVHAASITDTLCVLMIIAGLIIQAGWTLVSAKLIMILLLLWYTSPTASHALVKAAHHAGLTPWKRGDKSSKS